MRSAIWLIAFRCVFQYVTYKRVDLDENLAGIFKTCVLLVNNCISELCCALLVFWTVLVWLGLMNMTRHMFMKYSFDAIFSVFVR